MVLQKDIGKFYNLYYRKLSQSSPKWHLIATDDYSNSNALCEQGVCVYKQNLNECENFTLHKLSNKISESKINLFTDLSYLFSKPIEFEDDTLDYIPTQYIAEYAKNLGYDGITFESSLTPELSGIDGSSIDTDRYNVVVFNYEKCIPVRSNLFEVFGQYTECKQIDNDNKKLSVNMPINEMIETALMLN